MKSNFKLLVSLPFILMGVWVWGQSTIVFNGAEDTGTTWTTSVNTFSNSPTNSGTPADRIKSGSKSFQANNGIKSLTTNSASTSGYTNCFVELWTASISTTSGNGADDGDYIKVWTSNTASFAATPDITIDGTNNLRYGMNGTGIVTTTAGAALTYDYPSGGTKTGTDAKSKLIVDIPNAWTAVYLKIETSDNDAAEVWCIDDISLKGTSADTNTSVQFASATYTQTEDGTSVNICANITNPSSTVATTVEVALTTSGSPHLTSYSTQTLTFPANSSAAQCVLIAIADNTDCSGHIDYGFELQNITGGTSAEIGTLDTTELTVTDDDIISGTFKKLQFETGDDWGYSGTGVVNTTLNKYYGTQSYRMGGISNLTTDNIALAGYSNVTLQVAFAASGPDSDDDLFLDISYDNGSTWTGSGSIQLVDGYSGTNINMGSTSISNPTTVAANPWIVNIPATENQIMVRLRTTTNSDTEYYWIDDIILSGDICNICNEPTTDAVFHSNSPQNITGTTVTLNWTNGNGTNRIVLLKEANAITFVPVDHATYAANANFSMGTALSDGSKVVYNGSASTTNITGLTPGTIYHAKIYEYGCASGNENYLTSGNPTTDLFVTTPDNPATFTEGCVSSTSIQLHWTAPAVGNFQGYLLTVRQGASPSAVNSIDPSSITTANTNFGLAGSYGTSSKYLYKGSGTTASITGLTSGQNYTFKLYAYTDAGDVFEYATGTQTSHSIHLANVTSASASGSNNSVSLGWTNPSVGCFDEILIVANETAGITFIPSGDGSAYTAHSVYAGINSIVYKGSGNTLNVTGLTNGTTYYFEIFLRKGTEWSSGVEVYAIPNTSTILQVGDLAIVAVNTSAESSGSSDEITLVCFKDITPGTQIFFTDNGYERVTAGLWGNTEGIVSMTRNNTTLTKGTFITIHSNDGGINNGTDFKIYTCGSEDPDWIKDEITTNHSFDLNKDDQVWFMQGGSWSNVNSGIHNAGYTGNVLYGWTDIPWKTAPNYASSSGSTVYPGFNCYSTDVNNSQTGFSRIKFEDPDAIDFTSTTRDQLDWIALINTDSNWTEFNSDPNYDAGGYDYYGHTCPGLTIVSDTHIEGKWMGTEDSNWFNCSNWDNLKVPTETIDVSITGTAINEVMVSSAATYSDLYSDIAKTKNLTIQNGNYIQILNAADVLQVHGDLTIESGASLNMNGATGADGNLYLKGNWDNQAGEADFLQGEGTVHFVGTTAQTVTCNTGTEVEHFYNVVLDNPNGFTTDSFNDDLHAEGDLTLSQGNLLVKTGHYALAANNLNIATGSQISVADKGSLIQTGTGTVTGGDATAFKITKTTGSYYNYDYIYWSSPVEGLNIQDVFATVNGFNNYKYKFAPQLFNDQFGGIRTGLDQTGANADGFDDQGDDWTYYPSGIMDKGLGYIVMGLGSPSSFSSTNINTTHSGYTVNFTGQKVNNGSIDVVLHKDKYHLDEMSGYDDKNINLNLVGNPYPSAISLVELYNDNATYIEPNFYFWTHEHPISNAFLGPWAYNFSNNSMYSATVSGNSVTTANPLFANPLGLDYTYVASGQAFFVQAKNSISSGATQLNFNNSMRGVTNPNTSFLRMQNTNEESLNRIWLSMTEINGDKNFIALGFGANNTDDLSLNDVYRMDSGNDTEFYSLIPQVQGDFDIQFLSEFSDDKTIPLGMEIRAASSYAIQIEQTEGVFVAGQKIYLEDTYLDIIHEMGLGPYTFTQTVGENINNRFILRFTNSALGNEETVFNQVKVYPNPSTGVFNIAYYGSETLQYTIYDLTGKTVMSGTGNTINLSQQAIGLYFAKITDGSAVRTLKLVRE